MWVFLSLLIALSGGALSLDKLNMCMDGKHHKVEPGREGDLYKQVMNSSQRWNKLWDAGRYKWV